MKSLKFYSKFILLLIFLLMGNPNNGWSRWLTRDPLEAKYPYFSPYSYAANSPIVAKDSDGRDIVLTFENKDGNMQTIRVNNVKDLEKLKDAGGMGTVFYGTAMYLMNNHIDKAGMEIVGDQGLFLSMINSSENFNITIIDEDASVVDGFYTTGFNLRDNTVYWDPTVGAKMSTENGDIGWRGPDLGLLSSMYAQYLYVTDPNSVRKPAERGEPTWQEQAMRNVFFTDMPGTFMDKKDGMYYQLNPTLYTYYLSRISKAMNAAAKHINELNKGAGNELDQAEWSHTGESYNDYGDGGAMEKTETNEGELEIGE